MHRSRAQEVLTTPVRSAWLRLSSSARWASRSAIESPGPARGASSKSRSMATIALSVGPAPRVALWVVRPKSRAVGARRRCRPGRAAAPARGRAAREVPELGDRRGGLGRAPRPWSTSSRSAEQRREDSELGDRRCGLGRAPQSGRPARPAAPPAPPQSSYCTSSRSAEQGREDSELGDRRGSLRRAPRPVRLARPADADAALVEAAPVDAARSPSSGPARRQRPSGAASAARRRRPLRPGRREPRARRSPRADRPTSATSAAPATRRASAPSCGSYDPQDHLLQRDPPAVRHRPRRLVRGETLW